MSFKSNIFNRIEGQINEEETVSKVVYTHKSGVEVTLVSEGEEASCDIYFKVSDKMYTEMPERLGDVFTHTVDEWLRRKQSNMNGRYEIYPKVYTGDESKRTLRVEDGQY